MKYIVGIDIGGSHITAGLVNMTTRKLDVASITRNKIDSSDTAPNIIQAWAETIHRLTKGDAAIKIGIAMPGPFDYEQGISYIKGLSKYESLYGQNVKALLSEALSIPNHHIRLKNDAACFLQGEIFSNEAWHSKRLIGLTIGTGIGTAKAVNGIAEDADRWKVPMHGNIAEEFLSTRWFVKRYAEVTGNTIQGVKQFVDTLKQQPDLQSIFDEFALNLTTFLIEFIEDEKPEFIVIGGNIAQASNYFLQNVKLNLESRGYAIPIYISILGEHALLMGSASLWKNQTEPLTL